MDIVKLQKLEDRLGYSFSDKNELFRALTHPSFSKKIGECRDNNRDCPHQSVYATLGDALLKAAFISILMKNGLKTKGDITITKADLENNLRLTKVGERLHLLEENYILHRAGCGEKLKEASEALYSDTVEALFGAIFIDSNRSMSAIEKCVLKVFAAELNEMVRRLEHVP